MSSATPVAGTPGAVSAESLLEKYNLPEGTNADAIARVMARLGDLPVSSAEKPRGDPAGGDPGAARSGGARVDASARRNQMRFTSGGEPVARVSWSPALARRYRAQVERPSRGPRFTNDPRRGPARADQDLYGDDVEETVRASAKRALTAAGYGSPVLARASPARASPAGRASASRPRPSRIRERARPRSASAAATSTSERPTRPTPLTTKETMGKLGELRYEARAATQRARRAERALRGKEQELEELKAKALRSRASVRRSPRD